MASVTREGLDTAADWLDQSSGREGEDVAAGRILTGVELDRPQLEAHAELRVPSMTTTLCSGIAGRPDLTTELIEAGVKTAYEYGALTMLKALLDADGGS